MKTTPSSQPLPKLLLAVVLGCLLALAALPLSAADVSLKASDASGTTSWTGSTNWSNGAVPGSANNYFTGPFQMRTPVDNTAFTGFAGAFLSLDPGGSLNCKNNGNFTNSSLRLNGGTIWLGGGSVATNIVHYGAIVLNATTNSAIATDTSTRSVVFNSVISGSGSSILLISNIAGGVTLAGANTFSNPILVTNASLLKTANAAALGTAAGATVVAAGSTLDVNAQNLGAEPVFVGGTGIGNNGAIINSSSTGQNNALRYVTLTANTTFGGTGRWDIRNAGGGLLTGGGYAVTKVGANQVTLVDIGNPDLGDITINAGILAFEVGTTLGRPGNTLTLTGGTLQFYNSTVSYEKNFVFNGGTVAKLVGNTTLLSPITLGGNVTFQSDNSSGTDLNLNASISGTGGLTKTGAGRVILKGTNTYTGNTIVGPTGGGSVGAGAILAPLVLASTASISNSPLIQVNAGNLFDVAAIAGGFNLMTNQTLSGGGRVFGNVNSAPGSVIGGNGLVIMGDVTEDAGAVVAPGGWGAAGQLTAGQNLTLNNGAILALDLTNSVSFDGGSNDLLIVGANLTLSGTVQVNFGFLAGAPVLGQRYTLIQYYGTLTGGAGNLVAVSSAYTAVFDDTTPGEIGVTFSAGTANSLVWGGDGAANRWEVGGALNWTNAGVPSVFAPGDNTFFDDASSNPTVNLVGGLAPAAVTVNSSSNYTFAGSGSLVAGAITKQGTGTFTVNTANTFSDPTVVTDGMLKTGNGAALGNTLGGTTISGSGTLDVNGQNLGMEAVTVSGPGYTNGGAILNNGGGQQNALRFVTLAGDTTFGGTQRWDIRANPTATLSSGGQPFKITKVGPITGYTPLVGVTVDPALGDIDVQGGGFGYETTTTSLGDPTKTLNIGANAYFLMYQTVYPLNKLITIQAGGTNRVDSGNNTNLGPITLVSGSGSFDIRSPLAVLSPIDGAGSLVKVGGSVLYLLGTNSFSGVISNTAGTLEAISYALPGGITNNAPLIVNQSIDGTLAGPITGTGTFLKRGTGKVTITNPMGLTNTITPEAGSLALGADNVLGTGLIDLRGASGRFPTIESADAGTRTLTNSISISTDTRLGSVGSGDLILSGPMNNGGAQKILSVSNAVTTFSRGFNNTGVIVKDGPGQLALGGPNNNAGLIISNGTVALASGGYFSNNPSMTIISGAVLDVSAGSGATFTNAGGKTLIAGRTSGFANDIVGNLSSTGTVIIVGVSRPGTLTISGGLSLGGGTLNFDLASPGVVGSGVNDLIAIGGPLNLANTTTINLNPLTGSLAAGTYTLINGGTSLASGGLANLTLGGTNGSPQTFVLDVATTPGSVLLVVGGTPASLVWSGFPSATWDLNSSVAWLNGGVPSRFYNFAAAIIDPTAVNPNINLTIAAQPTSVSVSGPLSYFYTISGSGKISGSTGISKTGDSTLLLSTANDFTGPISVTGGQLRMGNAGAFGAAASITVTSGGQIEMNGQNVGAARAYSYFLGGAGYDGTGVFKNSGTGQGDVGSGLRYVTLLGDSTFGGTGRLDLGGNEANLGWLDGGGYRLIATNADRIALRGSVVGVSEFVVNRGILYGEQFSGQLTTLVTVNPGASLAAYSYTAPGSITNSAAITLNGGTLGAGGQAAGQRVVWTGPVTVTANSFINTVLLNGNDDLRLEGTLNGAGNLSVSGAKIFELTADSRPTYAGNITVNSGALLRLADVGTTGSGLVTNLGTFDFTQPAFNAFTNVIFGTGTIAKNGTNILQLAGAGEQFDNLAILNVNSGQLDLNSLSETVRNLGGGGVITNSGAGSVLTLANPSGTPTFSGNIDGDIQVVIKDAATKNTTVQIFSGSNRFTGKLVIDNGHLRAANDWSYGAVPAAFDASNITLKNGGVLQNFDSFLSLNANRGIFLESGDGVLYVGWNKEIAVNGAISGPGNLFKTDGGRLILNAASTYTGNTVINQGILALSALGSISASPLITVVSGAAFDVSARNGFPLASGQTLAGVGTVIGNVGVTPGSVVTPGTSIGTLTLTNSIVLSGGKVVFELGSVTTEGGAFNDLIVVGGNLVINGPTQIKIDPIAVLATGAYTLFSYGGAIVGNPADLQLVTDSGYSFVLDTSVPGKVRVVASGAGALLSWVGDSGGNPTADWDMNITADWANAGSADTFQTGDQVLFDDGGISTNANLIGTLIPASVLANHDFIDYLLSGPGRLSGASGLAKIGSGKFILANSGVNDFTGASVISNGVLQIGLGGTAGNLSSSTISNFATLIYNRGDNQTVSSVLWGSGLLQKDGTNILTLSGASAFTGPIAVNSGTLKVGNAAAFGYSSAVAVNSGGQVDLAGISQGPSRGYSYSLAGSGPDGRGALLNTGGSVAGNSAVSNVTLTADASIGNFGTGADFGRFDIGTGGTGQYGLFNGGNFSLTKVGPGMLNLRMPSTNFPLAVVSSGLLKGENYDFNLATNILVYSNATVGVYGNRTNLSAITLFAGATNVNDGGNGYAAWLGPITNLGPATFQVTGINGNGHIGVFGNLYGSDWYNILGANSRYVELWANNDATFSGNWNIPVNNTLRLSGSGTPGVGIVTNLGTVDVFNTNATTLAAAILGVGNFNQQSGAAPLTITNLMQAANVRAQSGRFTNQMILNAGANVQTPNLLVGQANGAGSLLVLPGAVATVANYHLGEQSGQTGMVVQVGGDITVSNQLRVGHWGNNVSTYLMGGGTMSLIGTPAGVVNQSGVAEQNGIVYLGIDGVGLFTQTGGVANVHGIVLDSRGATTLGGFVSAFALEGGTMNIGPSGIKTGSLDANAANIYLGGGILGASANWVSTRAMNLSGTNGNVTIDTAANTIGLTGVLSGNGGLVKQGSGLLTLQGANTYLGQTLINNGTFYQNGTLASGAGTVTVAGGILGGTGSLTAPVTVLVAGTLAPGMSIGTLTVNGPLNLGGTALMEISKAGATRAADKVSGITALTYGGTLTVLATGDMLAPGDVFDLFDAASFTGGFASLNLPSLTPGLVWDTSRLLLDGTITVTAAPVLVTPPADQTVECGTVSFNVVVTSAGQLFYQWFFGLDPVLGGTSATLTLNNVTSANQGQYSVVVSNMAGILTAGPATLTVQDITAPTITCPAPLVVQCDADVPAPSTASVTATDSCDAAPVVVFVSDVAVSGTPKIITRTYQATDSSGNSSTCSQTITVLLSRPDIASYEPFLGYTNGSLIDQTNAGTGYLAGGVWTDLSGDVLVTNANGLAYTNGPLVLNVTGGSATTPGADDNGVIADLNTNAGSFTSAGLVENTLIGGGSVSGTLYYSFLARNNSTDVPNGDNDFAAVELFRDNTEVLGIGNNWSAWAYSTFGIGGDGDLVRPSDNAFKTMDANVHLFVVKVQYNAAADDAVTIWMDPDLAVSEASQPNTIYQRAITGDASFNRIAIRSKSDNNDNSWAFDEIRFGTNWDDVTPTAPAIVTPLVNTIGECSSNVTFSVTAVGTPPIGYEWSYNAIIIPDATNATLTLTNVHAVDGGIYSVRVCNPFGSVSSSATLAVNDTIAPAITCPPDVAVQCDADVPTANFAGGSVSDGCDSNPVVTHVGDVAVGTCPKVITRTYQATDASGNSANCTQTITVQDTIPPVLVGVPADTTVQCDSVPPAPSVVATDNCTAAVTVNLAETITPGACADSYTITRTWTAEDTCGNGVTNAQVITVEDTTAPVLVGVPAGVTVECSSVPAIAVVTATDTCDPAVPVQFSQTSAAGACPQASVITRTWTAMDRCGNAATNTQVITVVDTTAPIVTCPAPVEVQCLSEVPAPASAGVSATDNCDPAPIVAYVGDVTNGTSPILITRTYSATDACGNVATCQQVITVQDDIGPTIACPADIVTTNDLGQCGAVVAFATPVATDNCGSATVTCLPASGSSFAIGATIVTCTATDAASNTNACTFTVTVNDVEAPTIATAANITTTNDLGQCSAVVSFASPAAGDNCPGVLVACVPASGSSFAIGATIVTCTATDAAGNTNASTFTVTVNDVEPPVITNCAPAVTIDVDTNTCQVEIPNLTTNVVAGDTCGTVTITQQPPAGTLVGVGVTNVTLVVKDAANNESSCVVVVTVTDPVTNIVLTVTYAAPDMTLTWPKTCADWKLQQTPSLNTPITWNDSTNTPVLGVDTWKVVVPANTGSNLFYQLKRNLP